MCSTPPPIRTCPLHAVCRLQQPVLPPAAVSSALSFVVALITPFSEFSRTCSFGATLEATVGLFAS